MMLTVVITIICAIGVALSLYRMATITSTARGAHLLSWTVLFLCAAKLARTPVVSDEWVDEWFHRVTGVWNITDLTGMSLAVAGAVCMVHTVRYILGRPRPLWALLAAIGGAWSGMVATFALSPLPHRATSFMSRDFEFTGWFAVYWLIYLLTLSVSSLSIAHAAARSVPLFRPGPAKTAVAATAAAGAGGFLYTTHKAVNLAAEHAGALPLFTAHAPEISIGLLALSLGSIASALLVFPVTALRRRMQRYQLLQSSLGDWEAAHAAVPEVALDRSLVPVGKARSLWSATRDPVTTNRMLIELADANSAR